VAVTALFITRRWYEKTPGFGHIILDGHPVLCYQTKKEEKIMILGLFTLVHVLLSLAGIGAGFVVLFGMLTAKRFEGWTKLFLWTTVATSATGFLFPFHRLLPSHIVGLVSLIVLAIAIRAHSRWRKTYVITAVIALYLNVFVLVAQLFMKVPALKALAPTQSEPPFQIAQLIVLVLFLVLGILAVKKFPRTESPAPQKFHTVHS
jgi:hypothetical protein